MDIPVIPPAATPPAQPRSERLACLDAFRGFDILVMIFVNYIAPMAAIPFLLRHARAEMDAYTITDVVFPGFLFIVGAAMALSVAKRKERGDTRSQITRHILIRAGLLLLLGWALYCIEPGRITFRFQNVLAQLAVTTVVAYAVMRRPAREQIALSLGLILLTEVLYRWLGAPGFDQPFAPDQNFGAWVDMKISGELSAGHWVSFNAIPTAAHTIWGVLAGQLLLGHRAARTKVRILALAGAAGVAAGFALTPLSPMIKRICTGSFVIASGGFCLLMLAFSYWLIDVRKLRKWAVFLNIVGLNSLFIYLFTESGGTSYVRKLVVPFTTALVRWAGEIPAEIATSLAAWAVLWSMCWWLYKKKIIIKI